MIRVSMNGLVVPLNKEKNCTYKEFLKLIEVMNESYNINITVEKISDNKKVFYLDVNNKYIDIIDINFITQFDVYRYICDKYLITKNKNVKLNDLIKVKEKFL